MHVTARMAAEAAARIASLVFIAVRTSEPPAERSISDPAEKL
jgi:hypothetical protein